MATKKSVTAAKKTAKKAAPAAKKTTTKVTTVKATTTKSVAADAPVATVAPRTKRRLDANLVNILIAELVGTFVLTTVALMTATDVLPLFVGLTLAVLVLAIGNVSGSHVNPAVTFGLWTARKIKSVLVPFYWGAQFIGAMASLLIVNGIANSQLSLDFGHFANFSWPIFLVELIGTAVFLFGLVSVLERKDVSSGGKALGVGLSLFVGILVASSLYATSRNSAIASYQEQSATGASEISHELYVKGATLNPAIALASTESTEAELQGEGNDTKYTRLGLETILSTLIGAAIGANLALLVAYRFRS